METKKQDYTKEEFAKAMIQRMGMDELIEYAENQLTEFYVKNPEQFESELTTYLEE